MRTREEVLTGASWALDSYDGAVASEELELAVHRAKEAARLENLRRVDPRRVNEARVGPSPAVLGDEDLIRIGVHALASEAPTRERLERVVGAAVAALRRLD